MFYSIRQFSRNIKLLKQLKSVPHADAETKPLKNARLLIGLIFQVVISIIVLSVGLYIVISKKFTGTITDAAIGWIGIVVGYWIR